MNDMVYLVNSKVKEIKKVHTETSGKSMYKCVKKLIYHYIAL